jgi:hypothetical protein
MEKKLVLLAVTVFAVISFGVDRLSAPPALPRGGSGSTGGSGASTTTKKTMVDVDVKPAVDYLLAAKDATSIGDTIKNLTGAVSAIKGLANTKDLSDSSKDKVRQLIASNATANLHMVIGDKGGAGFNSSLKADLNMVLTTMSGWGTNLSAYANTWAIK